MISTHSESNTYERGDPRALVKLTPDELKAQVNSFVHQLLKNAGSIVRECAHRTQPQQPPYPPEHQPPQNTQNDPAPMEVEVECHSSNDSEHVHSGDEVAHDTAPHSSSQYHRFFRLWDNRLKGGGRKPTKSKSKAATPSLKVDNRSRPLSKTAKSELRKAQKLAKQKPCKVG